VRQWPKGRSDLLGEAKTGESAAVMTESPTACQEPRQRDSIKAGEGMKISHVEAKDITAAANELLARTQNCRKSQRRNSRNVLRCSKVDLIKHLIKESPTLVAKAAKPMRRSS